MKGKAHLTTGIVTGVIGAILSTPLQTSLPLSLICMPIGSAIGSLTPDIDLPTSKIGHIIKPFSKLINKVFGHRTITHAPLWLIPLLIFWYLFPNIISNPSYLFLQWLLFGYILGFASHLLSDSMTMGGIPLLYPIKKKRYRWTKTPSGTKDWLFSIMTVVIIGAVLMLVDYMAMRQFVSWFPFQPPWFSKFIG